MRGSTKMQHQHCTACRSQAACHFPALMSTRSAPRSTSVNLDICDTSEGLIKFGVWLSCVCSSYVCLRFLLMGSGLSCLVCQCEHFWCHTCRTVACDSIGISRDKLSWETRSWTMFPLAVTASVLVCRVPLARTEMSACDDDGKYLTGLPGVAC